MTLTHLRALPVGGCLAATLLALSSVGAPTLLAQRGAAPAAAQTPAGAMPRVTVGGIRVTGPGIGANGTELRPFHESPGTTIALLITAPPGAGMVEIDDDTSTLKSMVDDKGQTLLEEGRFGSFPKVSDDGTAGLAEVEVRGRPSPGATFITAEGVVAVTMAQGSKVQKIPSVRLVAATTLKLGTATLTLKEVTVEGDSTNVTLGLARSIMATIRELRFLTAQGAVIETRRTGSGYMNDAGEMNFSVKTKDKIATLEFDVWQNLRTVKVPFTIKVGIGLDK